jgi:hypothetical protein
MSRGRLIAVVGPLGGRQGQPDGGARRPAAPTCTGCGASSRGPRRRGARPSTVSRGAFCRARGRGRFRAALDCAWAELRGAGAGGRRSGHGARRAGQPVAGGSGQGRAAKFETFHVLHVTARPEVLAERLAARGRESTAGDRAPPRASLAPVSGGSAGRGDRQFRAAGGRGRGRNVRALPRKGVAVEHVEPPLRVLAHEAEAADGPRARDRGLEMARQGTRALSAASSARRPVRVR